MWEPYRKKLEPKWDAHLHPLRAHYLFTVVLYWYFVREYSDVGKKLAPRGTATWIRP
jgi:hypothetical protein